MTSAYVPAWWLPGPHSMTVWGKFFRRRPDLPVRLESWDTPDGDLIGIVRLDARPEAPRLIVFHGLEGSARSHYVGGVLSEAARRRWGADVMLFRTCDGRMNRARRTYHSGDTGDSGSVVERVQQEHPRSPLALVGFSLGANVALKWLGERGSAVPPQLRCAVAVSTPFDLARSSHRISQGGSRLYGLNFLRSLKRKALAKLDQYPDIGSRRAVIAARTLRDFDDAFTSLAHGFRDAADYYAKSSSIRFLASIRVPTLLLSAGDDPFHPPAVLAEVAVIAARNAALTVEFPERGGHVGFVEGPVPFWPRYYVDRRVGDFCAMAFDHHSVRRKD